MKAPDPYKEQSEKRLTIESFLRFYNETLPSGFPHATTPTLREFKKKYPALFKETDTWSLGQHRKKFMDWFTQYTTRSLSE